MSYLYTEVNALTIKRILSLGICCLFILPLVFVPFVTSRIYQKNLENRIIQSSQQNLSQIANQMQYMITSLVATANLLCYDQDIISTLAEEMPDTPLERFERYKTVQDRISSVSSASLIPYNAAIFVLGENDDVYSIQQMDALENAVREVRRQKEEELRAVGSYILWIAPVETEGSQSGSFANSVAIAKTINSSTTNEVLGVVVINLYLDKNLQRLFTTDVTESSSELLLLNDRDELIYSSGATPTPLGASVTGRMQGSGGSFTEEIAGQTQMVDYQALSRTGWKLLQLSSYEEMMSDIVLLRNNTILINLLFLGVLLVAVSIFSNRLATPLHELCVLMGRLPKGDFKVRMKERQGKGEIAQLSQSFNQMVGQTEELFLQLEHSYKVRENLRLEALRAQVNPHFLFNTLNSIKWMAAIEGDQKVSRMIASLGNLLQYTLSSNEEMVPVEREISCIRDYVSIQKMRFGDRFELDVDIPEALLRFPVPLFLFQPIVENSILHAFDETDARGVIRIGGEQLGRNVRFYVRDNGKGMDSAKLGEPVDETLKAKGKFSKIGLQNVDERIKIIYGKAYGLQVESAPGAGTTVYLTFPATQEEAKA